jgi:hypothetical protein
VALVLEATRLLSMAKDSGGFRPIAISKVFYLFISYSIVFHLWGPLLGAPIPPSIQSIDPWRL